MARCTFNGIDGVILSYEEIAEIPEEIKDKMLSAEADVAIKYMQESLRDKGLVKTHTLLNSIKKRKKRNKDGDLIYLVSPQGTHHVNKNGKTVRNGDVAFVLEFGADFRGIRAYQWMRDAIEKGADDIVKAGLSVYDDYLKSKNV